MGKSGNISSQPRAASAISYSEIPIAKSARHIHSGMCVGASRLFFTIHESGCRNAPIPLGIGIRDRWRRGGSFTSRGRANRIESAHRRIASRSSEDRA